MFEVARQTREQLFATFLSHRRLVGDVPSTRDRQLAHLSRA